MNEINLNSVLTEPLGQRQFSEPPKDESPFEKLFRPEQREKLIDSETVRNQQQEFYWSSHNFQYLRRKLITSGEEVRQAVTMDGRTMHGNPIFRGTRIPVYVIVEELAEGATLSEITKGYPSLSLEQIQHGLDFAASLLRIYDDQIPD